MIAPNASWSQPLTPWRKVKTPGGFITYETDRARGISHGDLAWATMLAVINERLAAKGKTSVLRLWSSDEQKK
ncbi:Terminase, ATPase subunit (GpP) [Escherichia coli]|uniref:Terminase, ATPase subunit (GpP) n=1 Tax=Escherichia coli TaxID=562 RepID=A0A2X3JSM3_ECOLX|nr:Terminase, ATPase subunit (GpP) [Escherichia coli]